MQTLTEFPFIRNTKVSCTQLYPTIFFLLSTVNKIFLSTATSDFSRLRKPNVAQKVQVNKILFGFFRMRLCAPDATRRRCMSYSVAYANGVPAFRFDTNSGIQIDGLFSDPDSLAWYRFLLPKTDKHGRPWVFFECANALMLTRVETISSVNDR